jgi:hypothetical protein
MKRKDFTTNILAIGFLATTNLIISCENKLKNPYENKPILVGNIPLGFSKQKEFKENYSKVEKILNLKTQNFNDSRLLALIENDYKNHQTINVNGWVISITECSIIKYYN